MDKANPIKWIIKRSKKQRVNMALLIFANALFSVMSILFAFAIKEIIESVFDDEYVAVVTGGREENKALLNMKFDYIK